jgi:large subunit ribosomal protein L15
MQLHTLTKNSGTKAARRIGRGGKRGKTSGKGHKGQKSRAGHKIRPAERDIIKRIPKRRGYGKNRARTVHSDRPTIAIVNLAALEEAFEAGDRVAPAELVVKKLVRTRAGRVPLVKILGQGNLTKKLSVANCTVSAAARAAIEKAGGTVL